VRLDVVVSLACAWPLAVPLDVVSLACAWPLAVQLDVGSLTVQFEVFRVSCSGAILFGLSCASSIFLRHSSASFSLGASAVSPT
jgi:hypothetical protein